MTYISLPLKDHTVYLIPTSNKLSLVKKYSNFCVTIGQIKLSIIIIFCFEFDCTAKLTQKLICKTRKSERLLLIRKIESLKWLWLKKLHWFYLIKNNYHWLQVSFVKNGTVLKINFLFNTLIEKKCVKILAQFGFMLRDNLETGIISFEKYGILTFSILVPFPWKLNTKDNDKYFYHLQDMWIKCKVKRDNRVCQDRLGNYTMQVFCRVKVTALKSWKILFT